MERANPGQDVLKPYRLSAKATIRYGSYFITYRGLNKLEVQKGNLINEGQDIGTLYTDSNTQDGELEIVLSDMNRREYDPEKWFDWKRMPVTADTMLNAKRWLTLSGFW
jgi:hypothetical protein